MLGCLVHRLVGLRMILIVCSVKGFRVCLQSVLYNLLSWPVQYKESKLVVSTKKKYKSTSRCHYCYHHPVMALCRWQVVGIANTIDLPERLLPKICSRTSMQVRHS